MSRTAPATPADAARRTRVLVTPEGIGLPLILADGTERLSAFLIDLVIICAALTGLTLLALALVVKMGLSISLTGVIWLLGFFLLRNFYFVLFELRPRAATPGKRALGIRVASQGGGRLTADAVLARNLVRELELFLPLSLISVSGTSADGWLVLLGLGWSGMFLIFPLLNRDRLRVGDLLAGTWVVRTPRRRLQADLAGVPTQAGAALAASFTTAQFDAYGIKELHVLEEVLRQRDSATMTAVADRIGAKIGWVRGQEAPQVFLQAYYTGLRRHLERGLLFGRRRLDKFDRQGR